MERPILYNQPMVKAILEGRKKRTRRMMKPQPERKSYDHYNWDGRKGSTWFAWEKKGFQWSQRN